MREELRKREEMLQSQQGSFGSEKVDSRVKDAYRTLVRWLHPDVQASENNLISELWHDVQDAYGAMDLSRLETLIALSEMFGLATDKVSSVFSMREALKDIYDNLDDLRCQIADARNTPAWNFKKNKRRDEIARKIENTLNARKRRLLHELAELEHTLDAFAAAHEPIEDGGFFLPLGA